MLLSTKKQVKTIEAHLANGHLGVQGAPSGLSGSRSFMTGISDLTPSDTFRMANLPTWNRIDIKIFGKESLEDAFKENAVRDYVQTIDTLSGILTTKYIAIIKGIQLFVETRLLLSMADMNLAYQEVIIHSSKDVEISASIGIYNNPPYPERFSWKSIIYPHEDYDRRFGQGFMDKRMSYAWHPGDTTVKIVDVEDGDNLTLSVAADTPGFGPELGISIAVESNAKNKKITANDKNASSVLISNVNSASPLVIRNYIGFSRDLKGEELINIAKKRSQEARNNSAEKLISDNNAEWAKLWKRDIIIDGDQDIARQAHADLYYLYSNGPKDDRFAYQIMGIASPGYFGGVFWDCDVYDCLAMLPFNNLYSRNTARYRFRSLPAAVKLASKEGLKGAKYPVIADLFEGADNLVGHSDLGKGEIHFTADAAINCWNYYLSSNDKTELRRTLFPVMEAVADYFSDRVSWIPWEGRYELLHVHSAQEAAGNVHNCLFTNAAVKHLMNITVRAAEILGIYPNPIYKDIADKLHIPVRQSTGLWHANSGNENPEETRFLETNAIVIAGLEASAEQLKDIITVPPHFWDMSYQATIAAMAGNSKKMHEYLHFQATNFSHSGFLLRTEMKENDAGPYLTGSAALIFNLLFGAGGLRYTENGLEKKFSHGLPEYITRIVFPELSWNNKRYSVVIDEKSVHIEPL